MTAQQARRRIVFLSFVTTLAFVAALVLGPLYLPLEVSDAYRLVQIIFPVFAGYIGSAVIFLIKAETQELKLADPVMMAGIIYGSFVLFWLLGLLLLLAFYLISLPGGATGMGIEELSTYFALLVSFMNLTVGVLSTVLFRTEAPAVAVPSE